MPVIENNYEEVKNVHIISTSKNEEKKKKKAEKTWFVICFVQVNLHGINLWMKSNLCGHQVI